MGLRRRAWNARVGGARVAGEHLCEGQPAEEIIALAEELVADLVVVGSRRVGPVKRLIGGSVSEDVVHRASCPVLVVCGGKGPSSSWPAGRVVVADDGSRAARRAGDLAAEIADLSGAEVLIVRAYEHPRTGGRLERPGPPRTRRGALAKPTGPEEAGGAARGDRAVPAED